MSAVRLVLPLLSLVLCAACSSPGPLEIRNPNWLDRSALPLEISCRGDLSAAEVEAFLSFHVLELDELGKFRGHNYALNCDGAPAALQEDLSIEEKAALLRGHLETAGNAGKELVLVIHGGLVSRAAGLAEAADTYFAMMQDQEWFAEHHPLFVNWRTDALNAYYQQLFVMRNGEIDRAVNLITSPIGLAADLGAGLLATPDAWIDSTLRFAKVSRPAFDACEATPDLVLCPDQLRAKRPYDALLLTLPIRMATTPLIAGIGKEAWHNMLRRTDQLFWREQQRRHPFQLANPLMKGDLLALMEAFAGDETSRMAMLRTRMAHPVTIIGHSMGGIVAANLIGQLPQLDYQRIVFMGAALSIRDYQHIVYPLLRSNDQVQVFNLMLLPSLEATEAFQWGIAPRGSLLEWIDEIYESSVAPTRKTLGKWVNVRTALPTIPQLLRRQVTHRVFGLGAGQPQKHGEFNDAQRCFWRESYWHTAWAIHRAACLALADKMATQARSLRVETAAEQQQKQQGPAEH